MNRPTGMCFLMGLIIAGCGSTAERGVSNDAASVQCASYAPCGGDLSGDWKLVALCGYTETLLGCPRLQTFHTVDDRVYAFAPDGTYSTSGSGTVTGTSSYDASECGITDCSSGTEQRPGYSQTCTGTAICACDFTREVTESYSGTYSTSGVTLTTRAPATSIEWSYCVDGDVLMMQAKAGVNVFRRQ